MSRAPQISVLLPVRDAAETIDAAVASVLGQTLRDLELVAIDDGSTDDSGARLEGWAGRDERVRVLRGPHRGLVAALQSGLEACRAPRVARMDADDLCHPERLAAQVAFLEQHPAVSVVGTQVEGRTVDGGPLARGMTRYLEWLNGLCTPEAIARERFVESPLVHPSVMLYRSVLETEGYREGPFPEDYDLWLRLLARGVVMAKVPRVLLSWRDHSARATRRDPRYGSPQHRALKIQALLSGPLAGGQPIVFWGAGLEGKPLMRALAAHGRAAVAVVDIDPRKIGNRLHDRTPVVPKSALAGLLERWPDAVVLVAVGIPEARPGIRADLAALGRVEGRDYFFLR